MAQRSNKKMEGAFEFWDWKFLKKRVDNTDQQPRVGLSKKKKTAKSGTVVVCLNNDPDPEVRIEFECIYSQQSSILLE